MYGGAASASYQFLATGVDDILQRLMKHLLTIDPKAKVVVNSDEYSIEASFALAREAIDLDDNGELLALPERNVTLVLRVFEAPDEDDYCNDDLLLVTLCRKSGAITDFQSCFQTLRSALFAEAEVNIGDGGDENGLDSARQGEGQEEEELCEELGML